jgi:hypothetical protein
MNPGGHLVKSCSYLKSWKTGFKCLILCDYSDGTTWGSDGENHCD